MAKIIVQLTNFGGIPIYEGSDIEMARSEAKRTGYECTITITTRGMVAMYSYSPIGGFRQISIDTLETTD